jgi:hypothetical protein
VTLCCVIFSGTRGEAAGDFRCPASSAASMWSSPDNRITARLSWRGARARLHLLTLVQPGDLEPLVRQVCQPHLAPLVLAQVITF